MANYTLGLGAENDLVEIGRYTARTWGIEQARDYLGKLHEHFNDLGTRGAHPKPAFPHRADILRSRCQHHVIFFVITRDRHALILAVFHEAMDLLARLQSRLQ
ncbi:MAG: type II toxin-antitoxin system RelE/ParE family toxin [Planctomycetes bacterium]|nr:type II toxin-antitoxin system RelE/ParE family toxin [Planctomycetota bacterium]